MDSLILRKKRERKENNKMILYGLKVVSTEISSAVPTNATNRVNFNLLKLVKAFQLYKNRWWRGDDVDEIHWFFSPSLNSTMRVL